MQFSDFTALLTRLIDNHNAALGEGASAKHLTAEARLADMREKGWGTMDAVAVMDAADFRDCGFPPGMAKLLASEVQKALAIVAPKPAEPTTTPTPFPPGNLNLVLRDERAALEASSDADLLAGYDHNNPGVRGEILHARAKERPFLFFVGETLAMPESLARLAALKAKRPVTATVEIGGKPRRPFCVGEALKAEALRANPLRRGEALQEPGFVCAWTKESYAGIPVPVCAFMQFAFERGDMVPTSKEEARAMIKDARDPNALATFMSRYPESALAWDDTPEAQRPNGEIQPDARQEGRRGLPFPEPPVAAWPAWPARRIFLCAMADAAKWLGKLDVHLATYKGRGEIVTWHTGLIEPGQNHSATARAMLDGAHVAVVFTSPSMAERLANGDPLLEHIEFLANSSDLRVVPLRAVPSTMRHGADTGSIIERAFALPRDGIALSRAGDADMAVSEAATELSKLCDVLTKRAGSPQRPASLGGSLNVADPQRQATATSPPSIFEALVGLLPSTDDVRKFAWAHFKLDLSGCRYATARQAVGHLCEGRREEGVFREAIMWRLCNIMPANFDDVMVRVDMPAAYISGAQAAQGIRASDLIRAMDQRENGLLTLATVLATVI